MKKRSTILLTLLAMLAGGAVAVSQPAPDPAHAQQAGGFDFSRPEVVATGLAIPWGMDFLPDGDAVVVERASARVLRLRPGSPPQVLGTIPDVSPDGEGGLLGLAVSPSFAQDGWLYAYHTSPTDNRIVRFQLDNPQNPQPVLTGIPRGTQIHNASAARSSG
jgi:glucose/arabinose dehydrogenase